MLNKYNSNTRKLNRIIPKVNVNNLSESLDLTGSLENITIPSSKKFESQVRKNPNPIKLVNNKSKISQFYEEILEFSGRLVQRNIDEFDNTANTLTLRNFSLDYGTEGASPENFEVLVYGLHIPGDYTIKEVGNDVVVSLGSDYIDFDYVTINDIYVVGKLLEIVLETENDFDLRTENDENIII
jgi:hypothetical protein